MLREFAQHSRAGSGFLEVFFLGGCCKDTCNWINLRSRIQLHSDCFAWRFLGIELD